MFDTIIEKYYLATLGTILLLIVIYTINYWDIKPIEKKLITRIKRVQIELSIMLFETLIIGIYFASVLAFNKDLLVAFPDINDIYLKTIHIAIVIFCVVFPLVSIVHLVIFLSKWLLSPRTDYLTFIDSSEWVLIKQTIDNQILLKNKDNKNKVLLMKEWEKIEFERSTSRNRELGNVIYKSNKRFNLILGFLIISAILLILVQNFIELKTVGLIVTTLILVSIITIFYVILYSKTYYLSNNSK